MSNKGKITELSIKRAVVLWGQNSDKGLTAMELVHDLHPVTYTFYIATAACVLLGILGQ